MKESPDDFQISTAKYGRTISSNIDSDIDPSNRRRFEGESADASGEMSARAVLVRAVVANEVLVREVVANVVLVRAVVARAVLANVVLVHAVLLQF